MRSVDWRIVIKLIPSGRPTNQAVGEFFCFLYRVGLSTVCCFGGDHLTAAVQSSHSLFVPFQEIEAEGTAHRKIYFLSSVLIVGTRN